MPVNIAELERRARCLLTPEVYDYYAGGTGREQTLRANVRAWRQYWLLPRVLRDVGARRGAHARRHPGGDGTHDSA